MDIVNVQVRDVVFDIEFSLTELILLEKALNNTTLDLSSFTNVEEKIQVEESLTGFYDLIVSAIKGNEDAKD